MNFEPQDEGYRLTLALLTARKLHETEVGDDVEVVDAGQTFVGKVQAKTPDGRVKVSFAGRRPARDTFAANELKLGKQNAAAKPSVVGVRQPVVAVGTAG
jgi:hypothetical protein